MSLQSAMLSKDVSFDSVISSTLHRDPSGTYSKMDARSKAQYHEAIRRLSVVARTSERAVADMAVALAEGNLSDSELERRHAGYYLLCEGQAELLGSLDAKGDPASFWRRMSIAGKLSVYCGAISVVSALYVAALLAGQLQSGLSVGIAVMGLCGLIAASHTGVQWVNQVARVLRGPQRLPRLDYSKGIPSESRTVIAVPSLLSSKEAMDELVADLEIAYRGNKDHNVSFCLLTDFMESRHESDVDDERLLSHAVTAIEALSMKLGGRIALLHRARQWNASEGVWVGWERKRGKLEDFNSFIMGRVGLDHYQTVAGDTEALAGIKYVITLDDDLGLQAGQASEMASAMAHPLNAARLSEDGRSVRRGYGLLQPSLYALSRRPRPTRYEHLYGTIVISANSSGIKANAYQDLFGQSSFCGKGIYDVAVFDTVLHGTFPQNLILSHDMLEGSFVRCGSITDIEMPEEFPATYSSNIKRRHRWMRGDWQTSSMILPKHRDGTGVLRQNAIPLFGRYLIADNVRRILAPMALFAALTLGIFVAPRPVLWTLGMLGTLLLPVASSIVLHVYLNGRRTNLSLVSSLLAKWLFTTSLNICFLAYEFVVTADAALRSSFRMLVSKRKLLEWTPQSVVNARPDPGVLANIRLMISSPLLAAALAATAVAYRPAAAAPAIALATVWTVAPLIAWWLGQPSRARGIAK